LPVSFPVQIIYRIVSYRCFVDASQVAHSCLQVLTVHWADWWSTWCNCKDTQTYPSTLSFSPPRGSIIIRRTLFPIWQRWRTVLPPNEYVNNLIQRHFCYSPGGGTVCHQN